LSDSAVSTSAIHIRPAQAADVERIIDLLEAQEFIKPLTRQQLRALFTYTWAGEKPNHGLVLVDGEKLGGYSATIYSPPRLLDGAQVVMLNAGTLFVQLRYRARRTPTGVIRYSEEVTRAVMALGCPVLVFSARGPNDVVPKILMSCGFEEVCSADRFYTAGATVSTLVRPAGAVLKGTDAIRPHLTPEQLRIMNDHEPYGCRFLLVREGDRTCFVVTKRRRYRGEWIWPSIGVARIRGRYFPVTDVLHLSDPEVAVRSWGRLVATACLTDGTVGVSCTESFFGGAVVPSGTALPQRVLTYGLTTSLRSVDKLYSEQVLLP
jgi:hypothetical protein